MVIRHLDHTLHLHLHTPRYPGRLMPNLYYLSSQDTRAGRMFPPRVSNVFNRPIS